MYELGVKYVSVLHGLCQESVGIYVENQRKASGNDREAQGKPYGNHSKHLRKHEDNLWVTLGKPQGTIRKREEEKQENLRHKT